ncbi:hypothetical protein [Endozoicomonas sp.]|uniref:hypothetical protein n=1 Tax=Endozoicomonas sp. TaxID=1892382 RepID=UPI003AF7ADEC
MQAAFDTVFPPERPPLGFCNLPLIALWATRKVACTVGSATYHACAFVCNKINTCLFARNTREEPVVRPRVNPNAAGLQRFQDVNEDEALRRVLANSTPTSGRTVNSDQPARPQIDFNLRLNINDHIVTEQLRQGNEIGFTVEQVAINVTEANGLGLSQQEKSDINGPEFSRFLETWTVSTRTFFDIRSRDEEALLGLVRDFRTHMVPVMEERQAEERRLQLEREHAQQLIRDAQENARREAENARREAENALRVASERVKDDVPPDTPGAVEIHFQISGGTAPNLLPARYFLPTHTAADVVNYIHSKNFPPTEWDIFNGFPRVPFTGDNLSMSLEALQLNGKFRLNVRLKEEFREK